MSFVGEAAVYWKPFFAAGMPWLHENVWGCGQVLVEFLELDKHPHPGDAKRSQFSCGSGCNMCFSESRLFQHRIISRYPKILGESQGRWQQLRIKSSCNDILRSDATLWQVPSRDGRPEEGTTEEKEGPAAAGGTETGPRGAKTVMTC